MRERRSRGAGSGQVLRLEARRRRNEGVPEPPVPFLDDAEIARVMEMSRGFVDEARTLTARARSLRDAATLIFMLQTGAKPMETSNVVAEDIDFCKGVVALPWSVSGRSDGEKRLIPMPKSLGDILKAYMSEAALSGKNRLFGTHKNSVTRSICKLLAACGVNKRGSGTRILRNTFAVRAIRCGVPLNEVSRAMGWRNNVQRTYRYVSAAYPDPSSAWMAMWW